MKECPYFFNNNDEKRKRRFEIDELSCYNVVE